MIKDWIAEYQPKRSRLPTSIALRLCNKLHFGGLVSWWFLKAAFYGGTALRIFYGLNRFSEDLDFSLLQSDENFYLNNYLKVIEDEFIAQGMAVSIKTKVKTIQTNIESAFLKSETLWSELILKTKGITLIWAKTKHWIRENKNEVDTKPPLGF